MHTFVMPDKKRVVEDLTLFLNQHSLDAWCGVHDFNLAENLFNHLLSIAIMNNDENKLKG
jgi:hypothetical protein